MLDESLVEDNEDGEYSWLKHICGGILLGHDPEITGVAIVSEKSVYLDDAGHPADKPYLVLGGLISTESRWIEFEKYWREILAFRKLPFPFHATDFFRDYAKDTKLRHIVGDLVRVISNHIEAAFSIGLDVEAYKAANRIKRLEEFSGAPISMVSRTLRENIDNWKKTIHDNSPTFYFIENGTYQRGDMNDCWKYLDGLNPPIPVAKEHPSAQAADLYAYSAYRSAPFDSPSWQHELFAATFRSKGVYFADGRIMESDLNLSLSKNSVKLAEWEQGKVPIPDREKTKYLSVKFEKNQNKQQNIRRAKTGLEHDRKAES